MRDDDRVLPAHAHVARALGIDILAGRFAPDTLLPVEAALLDRFAVSRTVLREAVKTLAAKGFVRPRSRVGTRVLPPAHWALFDADVLRWKLALGYDARFRDELAEVRRAIEPRAAALAARHAAPGHLARMRAALAAMGASDTPRAFAAADLDFHEAVLAASGNSLIRSIGAIVEAALVESFARNHAIDEGAVLAHSLALHLRVVDAIADGDADSAAAAMLAVIELGTPRIQIDPVSKEPAR